MDRISIYLKKAAVKEIRNGGGKSKEGQTSMPLPSIGNSQLEIVTAGSYSPMDGGKVSSTMDNIEIKLKKSWDEKTLIDGED